jgi:uncharacterized protein (TIGR02246 family)
MNRQMTGKLAVGVLLLLSACSPPADTATISTSAAAGTLAEPNLMEIRASIDALNAKWRTAMLTSDLAALSANYADDAIVMMPMAPMMSGRAAVDAGFKDMVGSMTINDMQATTMDVIAAGDLAIETGTFAMTTTMKNAKPMTDKGKYITVWKRQSDGSWRIIRDINNTDGAPVALKK